MFSWTFLDRLVVFYFILFFFPLKILYSKIFKNPEKIFEHFMKKKLQNRLLASSKKLLLQR